MNELVPDLTLTHALWTARAGGRGMRWAYRLAAVHPGIIAGLLWIWWLWLRWINEATLGMLTVNGTPARFAGTAAMAASWVYDGAVFFTIGAFTLVVINSGSQPTHQADAAGRLRRVKSRHTSMASRRNGRYLRLRARRIGVVKDWRAAKRDTRQINKGLARLGQYRLNRYGRQWAVEDAHGAERTPMRPIDAALARRVKPSKKARKWGAEHRKTTRAAERVRERELASEWEVELAGIKGRSAARAQAVLAGTPRPGVDMAAPPPAPGSTAGISSEQTEWADRARRAHNDAARFVAELQGYRPPPAPTNGSEP